MPKFSGQNKKKINPRYFSEELLEETGTRKEEVKRVLNEQKPRPVYTKCMKQAMAGAKSECEEEEREERERPAREAAKKAKKMKFLEKNYIAPLLAKGYKRVNALPKLPGLKAGMATPVTHSGYSFTFDKFPIVLITTQGIRGTSKINWNVLAPEFKGFPPGNSDGIVAVLAKQ
tara:strand:- start:523 stop:1044 length:522 start_codon:yes stop_codon:yes gene_type:complete